MCQSAVPSCSSIGSVRQGCWPQSFFRRRINDIGEKSGKELSIETQLTSMINAPIPWNTRSWGFSHPTEINGTVLVKEVCVNVLEVG